MVISEKIRVLDPIEEPTIDTPSLSPRLDTLHGKTIGLYSNNKLNATELMDHVENIIRERFEVKAIIRGNYSAGHLMRREEWRDIEHCDAIILTHGD